ncbi:hypothetical protein QBC42DRAFT_78677 [Cladorrhinum samala]|uniref:CRIB domain-containing protein n=1 Tax=Cladorrhinum samala TaxID=585594 RepID=A0AAV9HQ77_9PEZI|nr:hypothetical protein QBC42DRAFT_78677 [Cladorrhinum samala]
MQMWAVSELPVYTVEKGTKQKAKKADKKSKVPGPDSQPEEIQPLPALVEPVAANEAPYGSTDNDDGLFLEPAVDGPPSPESIRALSKQMQRASVREKHHSHTTSSSGSASLRSLTSADRPSWENTLEGRTLSRKSSGRSTSSSMPSRERPESAQFFGKSLFNRRGRMRRESSAQSSAASSLYGGDQSEPAPLPPTSVPTRDSAIPSLFRLRRNTNQEPSGETRSKVQISGPYNFQHVTHTQKNSIPDIQRASRTALVSEFSQVRASQVPANGALKGIKADDLHFSDFSSDNNNPCPWEEQDRAMMSAEPIAKFSLTRPPSGIVKISPRRFLKRSQSQEHISVVPPPRPPRSPIEQSSTHGPPVPPTRVSSRVPSRHERFDSIDTAFRYPQPPSLPSDACSPPPTSYGYVPGPDMDVIHEQPYSPITSPPVDDPNWPLPCASSNASETHLPNVPEEDENTFVSKKSRASIISNSSLRGSQSVPMLRAFAFPKDDENDRRSSEASDTLGRFDLAAAQRALEEALGAHADGISRASWEDDIDYCYDHAAEADCDYDWDRTSLDITRDCDSATPVDEHGRTSESCQVSPAMLSPGRFEIPALSPVSRLSSSTAHEAITPTVLSNPKASNLSLPTVDAQQLLHVRKPSDASSFKESHGFTLSPSLLIPMDYQQQMLACEADDNEVDDFPFPQFNDSAISVMSSATYLRDRSSASTTATFESIQSGFEKHDSMASSSTDFTRLTASTTSLDADAFPVKHEPLQRFPSFESNPGSMPILPETEGKSRPSGRRPEFRSRGSESNLLQIAVDEPWSGKVKNSIQARRSRARTTSLGAPPPPNQYTLFPSVQLMGNKI